MVLPEAEGSVRMLEVIVMSLVVEKSAREESKSVDMVVKNEPPEKSVEDSSLIKHDRSFEASSTEMSLMSFWTTVVSRLWKESSGDTAPLAAAGFVIGVIALKKKIVRSLYRSKQEPGPI